MSILFVLFSLFGNIWIYKIGQESLIALVVCLLTAISFILYLSQKNKLSVYFVLFSLLALIITQFQNFELKNLTSLSNDEVRVRDERLSIYPAKLLQIGYYLDAKSETLAIRKIVNSLIRELDPNIYFFAGHPRERIGMDEFEKFPYVLLPVFLLGVYEAVKKKKVFLGLFVIPLILIALGRESEAIRFGLFPFFTATICLGLTRFPRKYFPVFIILYILVLVQTISYEVF